MGLSAVVPKVPKRSSCQETIRSVTTIATTSQCDSDHVIRSTEASIYTKADNYLFKTVNLLKTQKILLFIFLHVKYYGLEVNASSLLYPVLLS